MHSSVLLSVVVCALLHGVVDAAYNYSLVHAYNHRNFFSGFTFYTGSDPTNGFVQYVNGSYAASHGLVNKTTTSVRIGVDTKNVYNATGPGRPSVRLESIARYTHALIIIDLNHMPVGCGTWPAFWTLGPNWPSNGEIDIIEGVNTNSQNLMSLHTSPGCTVAGNNEQGTLLTSNCDTSVNGNSGCGVQEKSTSSYGANFNGMGGGVYAMQWTSNGIQIWFFPRNSIPASVTAASPDPSKFGVPQANFMGNCTFDNHFAQHYIVFDNTFCGDYAGNTYGSTSCPMTSGASGYQSCINYVAANPSAFLQAYWDINYVRVYQEPTVATATQAAKVARNLPVEAAEPAKAAVSSLDASAIASAASSAASKLSSVISSVVPAASKTPSLLSSLSGLGMGRPGSTGAPLSLSTTLSLPVVSMSSLPTTLATSSTKI